MFPEMLGPSLLRNSTLLFLEYHIHAHLLFGNICAWTEERIASHKMVQRNLLGSLIPFCHPVYAVTSVRKQSQILMFPEMPKPSLLRNS